MAAPVPIKRWRVLYLVKITRNVNKRHSLFAGLILPSRE
jgi:hypothetical protein